MASPLESVMPLDTSVRIVTPENIEFSWRLAGPFIRARAFLTDMLILFLFLLIFTLILVLILSGLSHFFPRIPFEILWNIGGGVLLTVYALLFWFWNAFFEAIWNGQTPGKRIYGLRTLTVDGLPITKYQAVLRNVIRAADLLLGPFVIIFMSGNSRFMRLGDVAAGTLVVCEDRSTRRDRILPFVSPEFQRLVATFPPEFSPSPELIQALTLYVSRRDSFTPERRYEIAAPLAWKIMESMNLPRKGNCDFFLCALYQTYTRDSG